jgi:hypothetical protein
VGPLRDPRTCYSFKYVMSRDYLLSSDWAARNVGPLPRLNLGLGGRTSTGSGVLRQGPGPGLGQGDSEADGPGGSQSLRQRSRRRRVDGTKPQVLQAATARAAVDGGPPGQAGPLPVTATRRALVFDVGAGTWRELQEPGQPSQPFLAGQALTQCLSLGGVYAWESQPMDATAVWAQVRSA